MYNEISELPKGYRKGFFDISDFNEIKPQVVQDRDVLSVSREDVMRLVKCLRDAMHGIAVSALSPNAARNITRYFFKWRKWLDQRNWQHQGEFVQGELEKCAWCQQLSSTFQLIQRRLGLELALRYQQDSILTDQQERDSTGSILS
ncbi:hypothetical protein LSM04_003013 [Trypanosoma melophagium]|uniref:uncharacterized protein n=1 Tax=Trypanosoma melophagium TaxID=715481 RepID=UPI00351A17DD|nr:hypothetical protein LSM04_003013 [Trypanosoma melophagium]